MVRGRGRVRVRARTREYSSSFLFFAPFFFMPKFIYMVTICNSEFCYKRRAISAPDLVQVRFCGGRIKYASAEELSLETCSVSYVKLFVMMHLYTCKSPLITLAVLLSCKLLDSQVSHHQHEGSKCLMNT